ncbi:Zinc finger CCHC domain-containing protein 18 [Bienertia sinuspersici]
MEIQGRSRLIDFLMVLNPKRFNGIIGSILAMEPLSTVSRAFHLVQQAEKQKEIVEGVNSLNTIEMSALSVTKQGGQGGHKRETKREKYSKQCEFCGMRGHVKDDCFKIYGYLEWFKNLKGKSKGKMVANVNKYAEESEPDTPLEFRDSDVGSTSNTGKGDTSLISNVVQKVIKALNDKQAGNNQTCNFAEENTTRQEDANEDSTNARKVPQIEDDGEEKETQEIDDTQAHPDSNEEEQEGIEEEIKGTPQQGIGPIRDRRLP